MPDFCCDVDVISVFTRCEALQMFTAFERNSQDLYFNLFNIKLTLFSTNNLFEVTSVTLV